MSNYTKLTNFTVKDALTIGDPGKIVSGTELDAEFNSIQQANNSKANTDSPTLTGIPLAPTAAPGTNTTQLATTAFVQAAKTAILEAVYPVGSMYTSLTDATNPATLLGFGTWVALTGVVQVGLDTGDTAFDTLGETGGAKDAIVPAHTHTGTATAVGDHTHTIGQSQQGSGGYAHASGVNGLITTSGAAGAHSHSVTVDSTGDSATNANLQPYVVVAMWKRTA